VSSWLKIINEETTKSVEELIPKKVEAALNPDEVK
jgi:hypothetical protein